MYHTGTFLHLETRGKGNQSLLYARKNKGKLSAASLCREIENSKMRKNENKWEKMPFFLQIAIWCHSIPSVECDSSFLNSAFSLWLLFFLFLNWSWQFLNLIPSLSCSLSLSLYYSSCIGIPNIGLEKKIWKANVFTSNELIAERRTKILN